MIDEALGIINAAACLMVSWVSGCLVLRLGRPVSTADTALKLGLLGVCIYGVGIAVTPLAFELAPNVLSVCWRMSAAMVAIVVYDRVFSWRQLRIDLLQIPRRVWSWVLHHIDVGRNPPTGRSR